MGLEIENRGKGFIGEVSADWEITQTSSPLSLGQGVGKLGNLRFGARCDDTSKFTVDNYLSVQHYYDDQTNRWLSTFDGNVQSANIVSGFGRFTMTSLLARLDVDRVASVDPSGTYVGEYSIPVMEYTIPGNGTFTTGGYYTSVGSQNVFVSRPTTIWDIACETNYAYVLCDGGHNGQVVVMFGNDGTARAVWPVYSDATDLAGPESKLISIGVGGSIFIGQSGAKRIKQFTTAGVFVTQWGSAGSGDGQFQTISGLAVDPSFNSIFVSDSVLGRIQRFNYSGVYQNKWGTAGTGSGNTVFNGVNFITSEPGSSHLFVSDNNARVRLYDSFGNLQTQPMGTYDFLTNTSQGEFVTGQPIKVQIDHVGNAYAIQQGRIFKYKKGGANWANSLGKPVKWWDTPSRGTVTAARTMGIFRNTGVIHVGEQETTLQTYIGSTGTIYAYILYLVGLAAPDLSVRFAALNNDTIVPNYPGWRGNVWQRLCEMCAVTDNAVMSWNDSVYFAGRGNTTFIMPPDVSLPPLELDNRATGRSIEITNYNSRYTTGYEVLYSSQVDGARVFPVQVQELNYVTVSQDTYPEHLLDPYPTNIFPNPNGSYIVIDSAGVEVDDVAWTNYGGAVRASVGEEPGTIVLTFVGPGVPIPDTEPPYRISSVSGQSVLTVLGTGVITRPEVLTVGTGVSESVSNRLVAQRINSPFVMNAKTAYTEGGWAAYNTGTPNQRIRISMATRFSYKYQDDPAQLLVPQGTMSLLGSSITIEGCQYVVEDISYNQNEIVMDLNRRNKTGYLTGISGQDYPRLQEIWGGRAAGEFDAFWQDFTAGDVTIAPLRNPYGV